MEKNPVFRPVSAITRRGAIALLVAVLSVGLLAGASRGAAPRPEGIQVEFSQLNWLGLNKTVRFPASRVGVAEFSFDSAAAGRLVGDGVFANVVVKVQGGKPEWAVRNLRLSYLDEGRMLGSSPGVQFGLSTPNGVRVSRLSYILSLTDKPLAAAPTGRWVRTSVALDNYLTGGTAQSNLPLTIGAWDGVKAGKVDSRVDFVIAERGDVAFAVDDLPEVDEDEDGCAPGGVARSIQYMLDAADMDLPGTVQDIYDDLFDNMGTQSPGGTSDQGLVDGKAQFAEDNDLDIDTNLSYGLGDIGDAIDTLNNDGDVEILISWNGGSGHVAMITSIIDNGDGTYQITYIDDADQGDNNPANDEHTITVNADGSFAGGQVDGFVIENLNVPTPTPSPTPTTGVTGVIR